MKFDLFISYSRRDNADGRIVEFLDRLKVDFAAFAGRPLSAFFDVTEIQGMDDWRHRILAGLRDSSAFLACLTPAYLESRYCEWEFNEFVKHEAAHFSGEGVAPIYFVEVPGWNDKDFEQRCEAWVTEIRRRQLFDLRPWFSDGEKSLREADVRERMQRLGARLFERVQRGERSTASPGNMDAHNPHFTGRIDELRHLRECVALGRVGVVVALHGLGGIGKTALVTEYAHSYAFEYGGGRWKVRCEGETDLRKAIADLAPALGVDLRDLEQADVELRFQRIIAELHERTEGAQARHCLLILDNVDEPALLGADELLRLPAADWLHVIVTTRLGQNELPVTDRERSFIPVDELPEADAVALIESFQPNGMFRSDAERDAAAEITRLVDRLPLAVELAATFLGQYGHEVSCGALRDRLRREGLEGLNAIAGEPSASVRHGERRVSATLVPTLERLGETEREAILYAALLESDVIVLGWLRKLVAQRFPEVARDSDPGYPDSWRTLLSHLFGFRLLQRTGRALNREWETAKMHRLVGWTVQQWSTSEDLSERRAALRAFLGDEVARLDEDIDVAHTRMHWRFSAVELNLRDEREVTANTLSPRPRWHPQPAHNVRALGAMDDYAEVWKFECCGKAVVMGDGAPSQFRTDGCQET